METQRIVRLNHKLPISPGNSQASVLKLIHNSIIVVEFKESCLKQGKDTFTHRSVVNLYIVYELNTQSRDLSTKYTLGNYLHGAVKLTMNADHDKYGYSGYGIGFDGSSMFGKNILYQ